VLRKLLQVLLLLSKLLLQLEELFLLPLADGVVLAGPFAALEGIAAGVENTTSAKSLSFPHPQVLQ
jgi:hypothetical protein